MTHATRILLSVVAIVIWLPVSTIQAQQYTNNEVGVGVDSQTWGYRHPNNAYGQSYDHYLQYSAPYFLYSRNLSATLAVEGSIEPWTQFFRTNALESGHGTIALAGIKAGWRGSKWGISAKSQVGVASWGCGQWTYSPGPYSRCSRITNFALEYGGVVERQISTHYALRFDAGHLISTEFDRVLQRDTEGMATIFRGGGELQHLNLRVGIERSFGDWRTDESKSADKSSAIPAWDIGGSFAMQPRDVAFPRIMDVYNSPSVWASWNFSRHVSWDSAILHSGPFRNEGQVFSGTQAGGRSLEVLTGVKAGLRRDRMGYFARLRAGTVTFGETERSITILASGNTVLNRGQFTSPILDAGASWEVYLTQHLLLRFDAGSVTTLYPSKSVVESYSTHGVEVSKSYLSPGQTQTGMLLSFGGGIRF